MKISLLQVLSCRSSSPERVVITNFGITLALFHIPLIILRKKRADAQNLGEKCAELRIIELAETLPCNVACTPGDMMEPRKRKKEIMKMTIQDKVINLEEEKQAELKAETLHKEGVNQEVKSPRTLELNKDCRC